MERIVLVCLCIEGFCHFVSILNISRTQQTYRLKLLPKHIANLRIVHAFSNSLFSEESDEDGTHHARQFSGEKLLSIPFIYLVCIRNTSYFCLSSFESMYLMLSLSLYLYTYRIIFNLCTLV
jgi:hypothetical protein